MYKSHKRPLTMMSNGTGPRIRGDIQHSSSTHFIWTRHWITKGHCSHDTVTVQLWSRVETLLIQLARRVGLTLVGKGKGPYVSIHLNLKGEVRFTYGFWFCLYIPDLSINHWNFKGRCSGPYVQHFAWCKNLPMRIDRSWSGVCAWSWWSHKEKDWRANKSGDPFC